MVYQTQLLYVVTKGVLKDKRCTWNEEETYFEGWFVKRRSPLRWLELDQKPTLTTET
jgi:hypothetical protein